VLDVGEPKYLNSPETPLFSKGRELYGLFLARNAIRDAGRVVVVEGYMDVVALAQHGIEYAVATLGTATTPTHVKSSSARRTRLCSASTAMPPDAKAAWRAVENTLPVLADGKNAQFLFLPDGEDPDDYIRARGKAAFEGLIAKATPLSEFLLHELAGGPSTDDCRGRSGAGQSGAATPRAAWRADHGRVTSAGARRTDRPARDRITLCCSGWPATSAGIIAPAGRGFARRKPSAAPSGDAVVPPPSVAGA
jgi:DNA primase